MEKHFDQVIEDTEDSPKLNPVCQALIDSNGVCETCEWIDDWTDDHEMCVDMEITVKGTVYQVSFWWINPSFLFDIAKSPYDAQSAGQVLAHMKHELLSYNQQLTNPEEG